MAKDTLFLVAHYYMRPKGRVKTQHKGWMKEQGSVSYDEQVAVTKRLKNSDQSTAKIILDLANKKIVRNGWQTEATFDQLFGYFLNGYPQYLAEPMSRLDPEYLTNLTAKSQETVTQSDTVDAAPAVSSTISSAA